MKILHITQSLDLSWGGIARVLPLLAQHLASAGDECTLAALKGDRFGTPPEYDGITVRSFAAEANSKLGKSAEFDKAAPDLVAAHDAIHLHGLWTAQNWTAGKLAKKLNKPMVITPHSMMMPWAWKRSAWKKRPIGWLFEHGNLRRAACIHALAEGEARHIRALGFNQNVEVIPNGIDPADFVDLPSAESLESRFPETRGQKWVLFLGRIAEQKGIIPGMQACFDVLAASDDWHLVVAGPDEFGMMKVLKAAVGRKGMDNRVTFTGMLSNDDTRACIGRASILLQPSLSEGLSMSILEALAARLPVLISNACNMPEVQDNAAGRVIEPNRRSISAALREMVALSEEERNTMGRKGRELAEKAFAWTALIPKYRQMYQCAQG